MLLLINVLILVAILKLLYETENAIACAGGYTAVSAVLSFLTGPPLLAVLIGAAITFFYTWGWFALLVRFMGTGLIWWLILIVGFVAPAIISIALASQG